MEVETINQVIIAIVCLIAAFLGSIGQLLFKLSNPTFANLFFNWKLIAGFALYGISSIIYVIILKYGELSYVYPFMAMAFIFTMLWAWWILKESVTLINIVGALLLLVAVGMMVR